MKPIASLFAAFCLCILPGVCLAGVVTGPLITLPEPIAAPDFDLAEPGGKRIRLSDFRGRPLIVNFWATWCPPCRSEMPSLQRAWEHLAREGIGVIAINIGEDASTIGQFTATTRVTFPLPMDIDSGVRRAWSVGGLPTTFVVDAKGRLVYRVIGDRDWDDPALLELVRALKEDRE